MIDVSDWVINYIIFMYIWVQIWHKDRWWIMTLSVFILLQMSFKQTLVSLRDLADGESLESSVNKRRFCLK